MVSLDVGGVSLVIDLLMLRDSSLGIALVLPMLLSVFLALGPRGPVQRLIVVALLTIVVYGFQLLGILFLDSWIVGFGPPKSELFTPLARVMAAVPSLLIGCAFAMWIMRMRRGWEISRAHSTSANNACPDPVKPASRTITKSETGFELAVLRYRF